MRSDFDLALFPSFGFFVMGTSPSVVGICAGVMLRARFLPLLAGLISAFVTEKVASLAFEWLLVEIVSHSMLTILRSETPAACWTTGDKQNVSNVAPAEYLRKR